MIKAFFPLLIIFFAFIQTSFAAYSGRVFVKNNSSGISNNNGTPLQNVVVTDGQNTVKTDKNGRFTLPGYKKTRFISVTTPSGYITSKRYIPVNETIKSYDFTLNPSSKTGQDNHSFIQITDTEIHNRGVASDWAAYLKEYIKTENVSFLMHTGDICYESGLKAHIQVVNSETMECPVYYGIGNHDLVKGAYGEQLFESIYGPTWYSFDVCNVHYVMTPMASGDYEPSYTREEVYNWLKNDLEMMQPGKQLVVFNHDVLPAKDNFHFGINDTQQIDLRKYNIKAWIYGHWHINYVQNQNGVYTVCTATLDKGGIDHSPSAFRIFQLKKDSIASMDLHYCFVDHQTVIAAPLEGQTTSLTPSGQVPLSVNAYHSGCGIKEISYTVKEKGDVNHSSPRQMIRKSDWNWYAELQPPASNGIKVMEIDVLTTYNDGKSTTTHREFQYNPGIKINVKTGQNWANLLNNPEHTGNSSAAIQSPLQLAWINNLGSNVYMTSPLIIGNRIFIASIDDSNKKNQGIYALDAQTGKIIWKYPTRNSVKNSIAYNQQTVFAQDADGYLYAVDGNSGQLKWEKELDPDSHPYLTEGLIAGDGIVYAGTGYGLGAYRCDDGSAIWTNKAWDKHEGATTTLTLGNQVLTAGTQWGALYGNNALTGEKLWELSKDGLSDRGASTTLHDGKFYVISRSSLFIIQPQTGEILGQKLLSEFNLNVTSTPLITDSEIIFGTADKGIVALDKKSLSIKWNTPTRQSLVYTSPYVTVPAASVETSPVISGNIIYFAASDGYLYGIKSGTGEIVWKTQTGSPFFSSVAVSGNVLVAADFSGNIYTFVSAVQ